jgi:sec-independent protein translocase protein TatC
MATPTLRRRPKNDEGRMPLRAHLAELRRRVVVSAVAIIVGAVAGWFLARPTLQHFIIGPILDATRHSKVPTTLNNRAIASAFNIQVKVAVYIGIVISSPVWIYQVWAFITPGLTKKERRTSLWFMVFAVPLFLAGVTLAVLVFPKAIAFGNDFALNGSVNYLDADSVITFAARLIIALGTAFLLPLFLVGVNMMGLLSGRALGRQWRVAVFIAFLFAAVVSPSPDASQMIIMALPLIGLYVISVLICLFNDRRKARRRADDGVFGLADDESGPLNEPLVEPGDRRASPIDGPPSLDDIP